MMPNPMQFTSPASTGAIALFIWAAFVIITLVVHIAFAMAVSSDATRSQERGEGPVFVSPTIWMLATLLGGVVTAVLYWAVHHSTLRRQ